jgi:hypothetical protein
MADCMYHGHSGGPGPCSGCASDERARPKECYECLDTGWRAPYIACGACETGRQAAKALGIRCYDPYRKVWIFP